ncbi:MAG: deoxyribodipyrimidine photo-lyase [Acidimicrobiales bacterium]
MSESVGVMWFRRDLRLADQPALAAAVDAHDRVVALFVHDAALAGPSGANRVAFLHGCLDALSADVGGRLVERHGDPADVVAAVAREADAEHVYATEDFGPYGRQRDDEVRDRLEADGRCLHLVGTPYAVAPGTLQTKSGTPFQVFTPFSKAWRAEGWPRPIPVPDGVRWVDSVKGHERPTTPSPTATDGLPDPGEAAAHDVADRFLAHHVAHYKDRRDRPDVEGTSRLSMHLKFGTIHPRQLLDRLSDAKGATTFASELCWREFYADVLFNRPESARQNYAEAMDGLEWDTGKEADERFEAWCQGRTGYPIVDAGMRQLLAEGWMHNRVRMIAASFLVKDLHIDWRRGATWFMHHLVDGDLASNSHGWQWTAGTGTDAAPFFRIFNPTTQGRRFDPDGDYVRRFVPELRGVAGGAVHEPGGGGGDDLFSGGDAGDYPAPIVDHRAEREEALDRYGRR